MAATNSKLDQALMDLLEAYVELEKEYGDKFSDDEDAYQNALIEAFETSLETALEEQDVTTGDAATILTCLSEALEHLDPSAFEDESEEEIDEDEKDYDDLDDADLDYDEDDADLDEEEEEEEEDDDD